LVGGTSKKQNWKGLAIAFIVIAIICLLIAGAIFLATNRKRRFFFSYLFLFSRTNFNSKSTSFNQ